MKRLQMGDRVQMCEYPHMRGVVQRVAYPENNDLGGDAFHNGYTQFEPFVVVDVDGVGLVETSVKVWEAEK